jgi:hypothetical protein
MLCEEEMTTSKTRNAFSVPHSIKQIIVPKTQGNTKKTNKYCTNCGMTNHNVETCRKEQTIVVATKATQQNQKPHKTSSYACHICSLNGHKMIDCPMFIQMPKIFHGKSMVVAKVQLVAEHKQSLQM